MSVEFARSHKKTRELPLTAMIDVVFILIFFFMLTTSFLRIESMELMLPSSSQTPSAKIASTTIVLRGDDYIKFDDKVMAMEEVQLAMTHLIKSNPDTAMTILVDDAVSMQRLVTFMDMVSKHGGQSLNVRKLAP